MEKVTKLALASRIIVLTLQFLSNSVIRDHKPDVFRAPKSEFSDTPWTDRAVQFFLGGLRHWDGEYYLHIAEHLYSYENTLAFYPLFPLTIRFLSGVLLFIGLPMSVRSLNLVIAIALNILLFCYAANALYKLTQRVFNDVNKSWNATLLFCFNPATIFFSAVYSETLFALICFKLMLECITGQSFKRITILLGLGFLCRSNGICNIGFPAYFCLRHLILSETSKSEILKFLFSLLIALLPLTCYIFYVFQQYCVPGVQVNHTDAVSHYARERSYILAGTWQSDRSPWCNQTLPFPYAYVQNHYWNVGFLRYYSWKQFPNFVLALPIFIFMYYHCQKYLKSLASSFIAKRSLTAILRGEKTLPFVLHASFLTVFCTLFVHVQISTRLIASSTPCIYWFAANYMPKTFAQFKFRTKAGLLLIWFSGYCLVGVIMFSNNLPWT